MISTSRLMPRLHRTDFNADEAFQLIHWRIKLGNAILTKTLLSAWCRNQIKQAFPLDSTMFVCKVLVLFTNLLSKRYRVGGKQWMRLTSFKQPCGNKCWILLAGGSPLTEPGSVGAWGQRLSHYSQKPRAGSPLRILVPLTLFLLLVKATSKKGSTEVATQFLDTG